MATEILNGRRAVKLYRSVDRGKAMYQLAYYIGGTKITSGELPASTATRAVPCRTASRYDMNEWRRPFSCHTKPSQSRPAAICGR